ncbi:hypothetical protein MFUL124B02_19865 [Myxococcus fulvus 124B02]|nr:hypothetical protein MFUL124B02_19865 [Myxococcus fulvus 124B02]
MLFLTPPFSEHALALGLLYPGSLRDSDPHDAVFRSGASSATLGALPSARAWLSLKGTGLAVRNLLFVLPLATFTAACGGEPLAADAASPAVADEAIGQAEQHVDLSGPYTWRTNQAEFISTSIGTSTNRTCFLTGLGGSLQPATPDDISWAFAGAHLYGDQWILSINQYVNTALTTTVRCVNTAANRTPEVVWSKGEAAKLLGAVTPNRRCFLTRIEASGAFDSTADYVRVWNDNINWYLGGDLADDGGARALCVDFPEAHGNWFLTSGAAPINHDLAYNPGGVACFLTELGGRFNQDSYYDGVSVNYSAGTRTWEMDLSPVKRGRAGCVK